jgi:hypothetical protein
MAPNPAKPQKKNSPTNGLFKFLVARGGISKIIYQPFRVKKIEVFTHYLIVIKTS